MVEIELLDKEIERVALNFGIPPCPAILMELANEAKKDNPNFTHIEQLVSRDVGLCALLLKTINSPFYGLSSKVNTVRQAIALLGLTMLSRTVMGLVMRKTFAHKDAVSMERFWDSSAKTASAAAAIARALPGTNRDETYTFALLSNCGIPVLMQRFPDYKETLGIANNSPDRKFTDVEEERHGTDHATMGYLLTKSWHLSEDISHAIRFHHEYTVLQERDSKLAHASQRMIAIGLLADHMVQMQSGMNFSLEWDKGRAAALGYLGLSDGEFNEIFDEVKPLLV